MREHEAELARLVCIPSVSGAFAEPERLAAAAELTAEVLHQAGASDVELVDYGAQGPAVVARRPGRAQDRRVLLYAHYDVQPADALDGWKTQPFVPTVRGGRLYGRGAADDKAGIVIHAAALRALGEAGCRDVDVTVLVEGEEETDSPNLDALLDRVDLASFTDVVVADGTNWATHVPSIAVSMRGMVNCTVEVRMLERAVHSGHYGGPVPDALSALARTLARLHDDAGRVAVPGLVSRSGPIGNVAWDAWRREAGVLPCVTAGIGDGTATDAVWNRPALAVLAIDAPSVVGAAVELAPAAKALVSLRVAPGDDAERASEELLHHLRKSAPWGAQVELEITALVSPYELDSESSLLEHGKAALAGAWGRPPMLVGDGASLPLVPALLDRNPRLGVLVTGVADPRSNPHGPDESIDLVDLGRACDAGALLLARLDSERLRAPDSS